MLAERPSLPIFGENYVIGRRGPQQQNLTCKGKNILAATPPLLYHAKP